METTAQNCLKKGNQLLEEGNLKEAIAAFRGAIELNPDLSWSYHHLGEALSQQGQLDEAIASYRRAIELKPDFSWSYHHLADALYQQQRWDESVVAFRRAIELNPEHFGSWYGLGQGLLNLGQLDEAIAAYRRASELEPEADWIQYRMRQVIEQRTQLDLDKAIASYRRAIELNPEDVEAYQKLLDIQPNNSEFYVQLGNTLVKQNLWKEAINCYRYYCKLNPNSFESYNLLGKTLYQFRQFKLNALQSNLSVRASQLEEYQKKNLHVPFHQLNDEAFVKATAILNEEGFITEVYRAYLKREPEPSATSSYSEILRNGELTRLMLLTAFRGSAEFKLLSGKYRNMESEIFCHWRTIEISYENLTEEMACRRQAIELCPTSYECYYNLGEALARQGNSKEAITAYQKAVDIGILLVQENRLEESILCYQKALETIPERIEVYGNLGIFIAQHGEYESLINCYYQFFQTSPHRLSIYHDFCLLLSQQGMLDEAVTLWKNTPTIQLHREGDIYDYIWNKLNQIYTLNEPDTDLQAEIKPEESEAYFRLTSRYKLIVLDALTEADKEYLNQRNLSLFYLELMGQNNWSLEEIYSRTFGETTPSQAEPHPKMNLTFPYQQNLVETGYIYAVCPFTGKILRSNQSFVINHLEDGHHDLQGFLYRFEGNDIFYLMVGCPLGEKLLLYFPQQDLIINFTKFLVPFARPEESINKFKSYMVAYWKQVKSYLITEEKQVVDVIGLGFNIGHYLWQDLTGIQQLYKTNLLHKVKLLVGRGEYFKIGDCFPEIPPEHITYVEDIWSLFKIIVDNNYVAFRANGLLIEDNLVNRITETSFNRCSQDFVKKVEDAKRNFPLIGVQIRISSRVWLSQVEGIANIINNLYADFPNLGVVFDGWSLTGEEDSFSSSWDKIHSEKSLMEKIVALIPNTISTYCAIGATTYETVIWNQAIDLSITPIGAGIMYTSWIANKPGVVYGHTNILDTYGYQVTTSHIRENIVPQVLVPRDYIVNSVNFDYECDWKGVYNEVIKILNNLGKDR